MRRRVQVVLGTRPEAIKLFPVIHALRSAPGLEVLVCSTGQHRAIADDVLAFAGVRPDEDLGLLRQGQSLDALTALAIGAIGSSLDANEPEWLVVQGDTTTAFAAALAAHYRRISVAHVEAGLRSGDMAHPWPEEANRRMITALAALHFAPTRLAAETLLTEQIDRASVHVTGNTVIDALHWTAARLDAEPGLAADVRALEDRFAGRRIVVATCHRRENLGAGVEGIAEALARLAGRGDIALVVPLHPNPAVRGPLRARLGDCRNVALVEPLSYPSFVRLLSRAHLILSDSGGVQEEAPALGVPVLVLRETTERPEAVEAGTARIVGTDPARIVAEAERLLDDPEAHAAMARAHNPFGDGQAAPRIAALLAAVSSG